MRDADLKCRASDGPQLSFEHMDHTVYLEAGSPFYASAVFSTSKSVAI